jgi:hypothetical protein
MAPEVRKRFEQLALMREPERLSCDGELSRSEIVKRHAAIMREWNALEDAHVGRHVTLAEIEKEMFR